MTPAENSSCAPSGTSSVPDSHGEQTGAPLAPPDHRGAAATVPFQMEFGPAEKASGQTPPSSADGDRLAELLSLWQQMHEKGQSVTPAELCRDTPQLQAELER